MSCASKIFFISFFIVYLIRPVHSSNSTSINNKYTWKDLDGTHEIYLIPDQIAVFPSKTSQTSNTVQSKQALKVPSSLGVKRPSTKHHLQIGAVQIIKTDPNTQKQSFKTTDTLQNSSPVFSSLKNGPPDMALAGGMIVYFKINLTEKDVKQIATELGIQLERKLSLHGQNAWFVKGQPGMEWLDKSNQIRQNESVVNAVPNWWKLKTTK